MKTNSLISIHLHFLLNLHLIYVYIQTLNVTPFYVIYFYITFIISIINFLFFLSFIDSTSSSISSCQLQLNGLRWYRYQMQNHLNAVAIYTLDLELFNELWREEKTRCIRIGVSNWIYIGLTCANVRDSCVSASLRPMQLLTPIANGRVAYEFFTP